MKTQRITQGLKTSSFQGVDQQLQPGTTLASRYLIQGIVGVGGMGAVYRARDLHFPNVVKRVAVKEMINQIHDPSMREAIIRNFEREANLLATLSHPSIPRIYDYFTQNERSYLILEFVDGKDMEALLTEAMDFFPEKQVITWGIELCDVLSFLHNHRPDPIIFRDMKPSNVMINNFNHVILVDFGIAKAFQTGQRGTMIGTEGYSPPEQYKGEAGPLSDIYALGATLHHLVTRRDPRLEAPFSFNERPIRQINPAISIEFETVINTALQYNTQNRFQSASEMKEALIAAARKTGVLAGVPTKGNNAALQKVTTHWAFECEDEIRGTPLYHEGNIYIGSYDNNLYALNSLTGEFLWKYPTEGGIVSKPCAYEGNVFFGSEDKRLHVVSQRSGKIIWTYATEGPIRSSPQIAEGHIFFGSDDGFLHAVNSLTGRRAWRVDVGMPIRSTPVIVDDIIYFGTEAGEVYCVDLGGKVKWRFRAKRAVTSSPSILRNVIFVGSVDSSLYALDIKTGFVVWRFRLPKATISSPAVIENFVIVGCADGALYCVDANSAKEIWHFQSEHQVNGSPLIYGDSAYCGSVDTHIYCLEYRTGRLRWKFKTGGPITGSPIGVEDRVYIGSTDHHIYALSSS